MASVAQTASGRKGFNPDKVTEDIDCPMLIFLPELSCSPCSRLFFFSFTPCPLLFFFFYRVGEHPRRRLRRRASPVAAGHGWPELSESIERPNL